MHEHNSDLISALAEGTLDAERARAAEASISSCDQCTEDLQAHKAALAAIASAPGPGLTMAESATLRRDIESALGRTPQPVESPRRRPWLPMVTAAAVVVVLLAVVPLVDLLSTGSGGDSAASDTTRVEDTASATAAEAPPATEAPATADQFFATEEGAAESGEALDDGSQDRTALEAPAPFLGYQLKADIEDFLAAIPGADQELAPIGSVGVDQLGRYRDELANALEGGIGGCEAQPILDEVDNPDGLITVGSTVVDGTELLIAIVISGDGAQTLVALDVGTCDVVDVSSRE